MKYFILLILFSCTNTSKINTEARFERIHKYYSNKTSKKHIEQHEGKKYEMIQNQMRYPNKKLPEFVIWLDQSNKVKGALAYLTKKQIIKLNKTTQCNWETKSYAPKNKHAHYQGVDGVCKHFNITYRYPSYKNDYEVWWGGGNNK